MSGGRGDSEIINTAETYDTETDQWEPVVSTMNNARTGFGECMGIPCIFISLCVNHIPYTRIFSMGRYFR